jgi:hypothetical protein
MQTMGFAGFAAPTNSSLIAALAALGGVLIGGLITAVTTAYFEKRRDRADVRQARRLVLEELRSVWNQAGALVETRHYPGTIPPSPQFLPSGQWEANRDALARHLDDDAWDALSPFMDSIPATRAIVIAAPRAAQIPAPMLARFESMQELASDLYSFVSGGSNVDGVLELPQRRGHLFRR